MTKKEIRLAYRERRKAISAADKDRMEDLMLIRFQQGEWEIPGTIMTYLPFEAENEYDPVLVERFCRFRQPGLRLACPVIESPGNRMKAVGLMPDTVYARNAFGIDEPINGEEMAPEEIGLVIVPLLAFSRQGYRVGYGKGYYDRFLAEQCPQSTRIGFSFFGPVNDIADVAWHDVPLHYCITPDKIHSFKQ